MFARMAPGFITQALGFKGNISNIGLKGALAGISALTRGAGVSGAIQATRQSNTAQIQAQAQGKAGPTVGETILGGQKYAQDLLSGNLKEPLSGIDRALQRNAQNRVLRKMDATANDVELRKQRMIDAEGRSAAMSSVNEELKKGGPDARGWAYRHIDSQGRLLDDRGRLMYDANGNTYDMSAYINRDENGNITGTDYRELSRAMASHTNQAASDADAEKRGFDKISKANDKYGPGENATDKYNSRRNRNREADRKIERDRMRAAYGINEHSLGGSRETGGYYQAVTDPAQTRQTRRDARNDLRDSEDPRFSSGMRRGGRNIDDDTRGISPGDRIRMDENSRGGPNSDGHR